MFDHVIQEVCDSSQVDFEESGVDQQTLLDLRQVRFFLFFFFFFKPWPAAGEGHCAQRV